MSGGSIYAFQVALNHLSREAEPSDSVTRQDRHQRFEAMASSRRVRRGTQDLGFYTSIGYLAPANLLVPLLITLVTDRSYLDLLAFGMSFSNSLSRFFLPWRLKLGAIEQRPLFLFNTTSMETGTPLVLTQSILHLPAEGSARKTARLDVEPPECCEKPLRHAQT